METILPYEGLPYRELLQKTYDNLASHYDARYQTPEAHKQDKVIFELLQPYSFLSILDLGCGTGLAVDYLRPEPHLYFGCDLSQNMISQFNKKHPQHKTSVQDCNLLNMESTDLVISLYGAASYIDPNKYQIIVDQATAYCLMFYKPNYLPDYYTLDCTLTDYLRLNTFEFVVPFDNFLIASNIHEVNELVL